MKPRPKKTKGGRNSETLFWKCEARARRCQQNPLYGSRVKLSFSSEELTCFNDDSVELHFLKTPGYLDGGVQHRNRGAEPPQTLLGVGPRIFENRLQRFSRVAPKDAKRGSGSSKPRLKEQWNSVAWLEKYEAEPGKKEEGGKVPKTGS